MSAHEMIFVALAFAGPLVWFPLGWWWGENFARLNGWDGTIKQ